MITRPLISDNSQPKSNPQNTPAEPVLWYDKSNNVAGSQMNLKGNPQTLSDQRLIALDQAIRADAIRYVLPHKFQWLVR